MTDPDNPSNPNQPDLSSSAFVLVAIPLGAFVPVEVLEGVEIFMTQGGIDDGDVGENGVALPS